MVNSVVIGLIGKPRAGKETIADQIRRLARANDFTYSHFRFSDVLKEVTKVLLLENPGRKLLQDLAIKLEELEPGILSKVLNARVRADSASIKILDGVRRWPDLAFVRSFKPNFLVYVSASPHIRWERATRATIDVKPDEKTITLEDFMKSDLVETERNIATIGQVAELKIVNNDQRSAEELKDFIFPELSKFFCEKVVRLLK